MRGATGSAVQEHRPTNQLDGQWNSQVMYVLMFSSSIDKILFAIHPFDIIMITISNRKNIPCTYVYSNNAE